MACQLLTQENISGLINSIDAVICDCDGVVWNGTESIPGVAETLQKLQSLGKKIFYVSNNSTKTRDEYVTKCNAMNYPVIKDHVVSSAYVTARYLKNVLKLDRKVFVVGSVSLQEEIKMTGITAFGGGPDNIGDRTFQDLGKQELDPEVGCVVVGLDKDFSYSKLAKATLYLQQKPCYFVATNDDAGLPTGRGTVIPGSGSLVKAVETASGCTPDAVCGKPHRGAWETLTQVYGLDASRTLMVGDRLCTDILFAANCKLKSLAVLTGVTTLDVLKEKQQSADPEEKREVPDYYTNSLADVARLAQAAGI